MTPCNSPNLPDRTPAPTQHQPLGQRLVAAKLLTPAQVEVALYDQAATGYRLGEIIALRGWLAPEIIEIIARAAQINPVLRRGSANFSPLQDTLVNPTPTIPLTPALGTQPTTPPQLVPPAPDRPSEPLNQPQSPRPSSFCQDYATLILADEEPYLD